MRNISHICLPQVASPPIHHVRVEWSTYVGLPPPAPELIPRHSHCCHFCCTGVSYAARAWHSAVVAKPVAVAERESSYAVMAKIDARGAVCAELIVKTLLAVVGNCCLYSVEEMSVDLWVDYWPAVGRFVERRRFGEQHLVMVGVVVL